MENIHRLNLKLQVGSCYYAVLQGAFCVHSERLQQLSSLPALAFLEDNDFKGEIFCWIIPRGTQ
jgi:hypothetical protein